MIMRARLLVPCALLATLGSARTAFADPIDAADPSAYYRISPVHSRKVLAVAEGSLRNGERVLQWDLIESEENQKWRFVPVGEGFYKILAKHSGKCLDVFGGNASQGDGVAVQQWDYNGGDNQKRCPA